MSSEVVLLTKAYRQQDTLDWIHHYQRLGFDHITIYLNDYEPHYDIDDTNYKNVSMFFIKGFPNQIKVYNDHYAQSKYDWQLYVDDDEYLWLDRKKYRNINEFVSTLKCDVFGVYWQYASYKDGEEPEDRNIPMKEAFRYTPKGEYETIYKSFVKKGQIGKFINPHTFVNWNNAIQTVDGLRLDPQDPHIIRDPSKDEIKLLHFWRKSKNEMRRKMNMFTPDHEEGLTYKDVSPEHNLIYTEKL